MASFDKAVLEAARDQKEIEITTFGRVTNKPVNTTIWITPLNGKLYVRSGGGMDRDWPKNLAAHGKAVLHLAGMEVPVRASHVTDLKKAKAVTAAVVKKYGTNVATAPDDTPTPAETATFELTPVEN